MLTVCRDILCKLISLWVHRELLPHILNFTIWVINYGNNMTIKHSKNSKLAWKLIFPSLIWSKKVTKIIFISFMTIQLSWFVEIIFTSTINWMIFYHFVSISLMFRDSETLTACANQYCIYYYNSYLYQLQSGSSGMGIAISDPCLLWMQLIKIAFRTIAIP